MDDGFDSDQDTGGWGSGLTSKNLTSKNNDLDLFAPKPSAQADTLVFSSPDTSPLRGLGSSNQLPSTITAAQQRAPGAPAAREEFTIGSSSASSATEDGFEMVGGQSLLPKGADPFELLTPTSSLNASASAASAPAASTNLFPSTDTNFAVNAGGFPASNPLTSDSFAAPFEDLSGSDNFATGFDDFSAPAAVRQNKNDVESMFDANFEEFAAEVGTAQKPPPKSTAPKPAVKAKVKPKVKAAPAPQAPASRAVLVQQPGGGPVAPAKQPPAVSAGVKAPAFDFDVDVDTVEHVGTTSAKANVNRISGSLYGQIDPTESEVGKEELFFDLEAGGFSQDGYALAGASGAKGGKSSPCCRLFVYLRNWCLYRFGCRRFCTVLLVCGTLAFFVSSYFFGTERVMDESQKIGKKVLNASIKHGSAAYEESKKWVSTGKDVVVDMYNKATTPKEDPFSARAGAANKRKRGGGGNKGAGDPFAARGRGGGSGPEEDAEPEESGAAQLNPGRKSAEEINRGEGDVHEEDAAGSTRGEEPTADKALISQLRSAVEEHQSELRLKEKELNEKTREAGMWQQEVTSLRQKLVAAEAASKSHVQEAESLRARVSQLEAERRSLLATSSGGNENLPAQSRTKQELQHPEKVAGAAAISEDQNQVSSTTSAPSKEVAQPDNALAQNSKPIEDDPAGFAKNAELKLTDASKDAPDAATDGGTNNHAAKPEEEEEDDSDDGVEPGAEEGKKDDNPAASAGTDGGSAGQTAPAGVGLTAAAAEQTTTTFTSTASSTEAPTTTTLATTTTSTTTPTSSTTTTSSSQEPATTTQSSNYPTAEVPNAQASSVAANSGTDSGAVDPFAAKQPRVQASSTAPRKKKRKTKSKSRPRPTQN
ncbi:unnamed protein product [Amoebophrya sp. A120]|nr:unnamed protein product [Amoebophrya sp. A120]|eukprot:GSA120T00002058001.1